MCCWLVTFWRERIEDCIIANSVRAVVKMAPQIRWEADPTGI